MPRAIERTRAVDPATMAGRALQHLIAAQRPDGSWSDFFLPAGESNGWVTGFVGLALAEAGGTDAGSVTERAWRFLVEAAKPEGGWGYNDGTPADADSTVWGLQLAAALGHGDAPAACAARILLDQHRRGGGGVATYADESVPRGYVGLPPMVSFAGWTLSHPCVSAAAANLTAFADDRLVDYLHARQRADGSWPAYWWFDDAYTTAEAAMAIGAAASRRKAADWAAARIPSLAARVERPPVFELAHLLRIMAADGASVADATVGEGLAALERWQLPGGGWPASARLRVPAPDCVEPDDGAAWKPWRGLPPAAPTLATVLRDTFTITTLDHRGSYTTATVLRALAAVMRARP
jgi:hypothetical protein